jgi:hypothetical protein
LIAITLVLDTNFDREKGDIGRNIEAARGLDPALFAGHYLRAGFLTSSEPRRIDL